MASKKKKAIDGRSSAARAARKAAADKAARAEKVAHPVPTGNGERHVSAGLFLALAELVEDGTLDARLAVIVASRMVLR